MSSKHNFLTRVAIGAGMIKAKTPVHIKPAAEASAPQVPRETATPATPLHEAPPEHAIQPKKAMLPLRAGEDKNAEAIHTILPASARLSGTLVIDESIVLDGTLTGDIEVTGENQFVLGPRGGVHGNLTARMAVISGQIEGNLFVERLVLTASGEVRGDIQYSSISMEHGCAVHGSLTKIVPNVVGDMAPAGSFEPQLVA